MDGPPRPLLTVPNVTAFHQHPVYKSPYCCIMVRCSAVLMCRYRVKLMQLVAWRAQLSASARMARSSSVWPPWRASRPRCAVISSRTAQTPPTKPDVVSERACAVVKPNCAAVFCPAHRISYLPEADKRYKQWRSKAGANIFAMFVLEQTQVPDSDLRGGVNRLPEESAASAQLTRVKDRNKSVSNKTNFINVSTRSGWST